MNSLSVFVNGFSLHTLKSAVEERLSESLPHGLLAEAAKDWQPSPTSLSPRSRRRLSPQTLLAMAVAEGISPELESDTNLLVNLYFFDAKLFRIRYYKRAHELILFWDAKLFHIW